MKLNRFITNEEKVILEELSKKKELILNGAGHGYKYFGVKTNLKEEDYLNKLLSECINDFVDFSNFTPEGRIRFQYKWDSRFQGVGYISIDELHKGFEVEERISK